MARALLRLRPDGIYEIVSQRRARRAAIVTGACLAACSLGAVLAAALSAFVATATALGGGAAIAAAGLLGLAIRARLHVAGKPLATTLLLRPSSSRVLRAGDARDAGG